MVGRATPARRSLRAWLQTLCGMALLLLAAGCVVAPPVAPVSPVSPVSPPEPLVPTPLPATGAARHTPVPAPGTPVAPAEQPPDLAEPYSLRWRVGIGVPDGRSPEPYAWPDDRPGWYLNWSAGFLPDVWAGRVLSPTLTPAMTRADLAVPDDATVGMEFAPMVRVDAGAVVPPLPWLAAAVRLLPGRTWLIGNEPDVKWQDNTPPAAYARAYHAAYTTIKAADPTAQVAIGGVSQVTPLRLAYLDAVLAAYAEQYGAKMPVDVWNMHAFVLQERAGAWGVDIPPGLTATEGESWGIQDHDDLALVELQVRRMRAWMQARGQQDKPLWITEYGILMPEEYGFSPERVRRFLLGSFDLFWTLRDLDLGYAADDDRLVQRWVWFAADAELYPTGNLFTLDGAPTGVLDALRAYVDEFGDE